VGSRTPIDANSRAAPSTSRNIRSIPLTLWLLDIKCQREIIDLSTIIPGIDSVIQNIVEEF